MSRGKQLGDPGAQELLGSEALRERPQVAGVIDEGISSSDARQLLVRGTAEVEIVDGVAPEYIEAAAKGESGRELEDFEQQVRAIFDQQARIAITPGLRVDCLVEPVGIEARPDPSSAA